MPSLHAGRSGRSGRTRLLAIGVIAGVLVIAGTLVYGAIQDRMEPGSNDTLQTPSPGAVVESTGPTASAAPSASADPEIPASASPSVTPPPSAAPEILLAVGDIAECDGNGDELTGALASSLPGTITTLGDTAYPRGTSKELDTCFGDSWGPVKSRIRWAVFGNHDYMTDNGTPLVVYMGAAAEQDGKRYYSDTLGAWHVVVLDANCGSVDGGCGPASPQVAWLREDLAASAAVCTVALFHQPRWSSGYHGNTANVDALWTTLADAGVELVLNGHEHDYERFVPLDASGAPSGEGTTEIVVGTGGGSLRGFRSKAQEGSVIRKSTVYGLVEATLADGSWTFRFLDTDGTVVDQGGGACH